MDNWRGWAEVHEAIVARGATTSASHTQQMLNKLKKADMVESRRHAPTDGTPGPGSIQYRLARRAPHEEPAGAEWQSLRIVFKPERRGVADVPIGRLLYPEAPRLQPPKLRSECADGPRPCPWVSCRHHLWADVTNSGSLRTGVNGVEPWNMRHSCALDVADESDGGLTLEEVGDVLGVTRERIRQVEVEALLKARRNARKLFPDSKLADLLPGDTSKE